MKTIRVLFKLLVAHANGKVEQREIPGSVSHVPARGDALSIQLYDKQKRKFSPYYGEVNNVVHSLKETHAPGSSGLDFLENPTTTIIGTVRHDDQG